MKLFSNTVSSESRGKSKIRVIIPDGLWKKCQSCSATFYAKDIKNEQVCPECGHHFRMNANDRLAILLDEGTFVEWDKENEWKDPIRFPGYLEKQKKLKEDTGLDEAVITGTGEILGEKTAIGVMDTRFIMGSMGQVVGEKITRLFEKAAFQKLPVILYTASGGARMQEGIFSLMQMAKISAAVQRFSEGEKPYIAVLTDPTTGGVTASFAMQGDIILAEPGAVIGFAGRRVISQTTKQELPDDFQKAEFLLENGFIDKIVPRVDQRKMLKKILKLHSPVR
ncbi:acetyl-CoA carboxylase, carboxyltransferase subunit beta [Enterococcus sp. LJL98]